MTLDGVCIGTVATLPNRLVVELADDASIGGETVTRVVRCIALYANPPVPHDAEGDDVTVMPSISVGPLSGPGGGEDDEESDEEVHCDFDEAQLHLSIADCFGNELVTHVSAKLA